MADVTADGRASSLLVVFTPIAVYPAGEPESVMSIISGHTQGKGPVVGVVGFKPQFPAGAACAGTLRAWQRQG
jgi:hypothetical protein